MWAALLGRLGAGAATKAAATEAATATPTVAKAKSMSNGQMGRMANLNQGMQDGQQSKEAPKTPTMSDITGGGVY